MTDIVARLRHHARVGDGWTRPDATEAADEIERLRAEVSNILAENDALRFALNNTSLHVAAARREGIEACMAIARERGAWASNDMDADNLKDRLEANGRMDMASEIAAAIRALLEGGR